MSDDQLIQLLRAARLRPTIGRIGVMRVLADAAGRPLCADAVFRRLMAQGGQCNIGTVYRTLQQCQAAGVLLRAWDDAQRRAVFRTRPAGADSPALCLVCRVCARTVAVEDAPLYEQLARVMQQHAPGAADQAVRIEINCAGCARIAYAA